MIPNYDISKYGENHTSYSQNFFKKVLLDLKSSSRFVTALAKTDTAIQMNQNQHLSRSEVRFKAKIFHSALYVI